jgi:hypothetical protein
MIAALPNRAIGVLYKALQTCHGNFDLAVDMIIHQEEHNRNRGVSGITVSDLESNAAQLRVAIKQQTKARKRAIADDYLSKPKLIDTTPPAAVVRRSTLVSTEPPAIATTNLKRSADHFAAPGAPPSKKQAGTIIKKEPNTVPSLPASKDTIRDKLENLLQSSRSLPNPRGMPPALPPPPTGIAPRYGNTLPTYARPTPVTPGMAPSMVKPDIDHYPQRPPRLGSRPSSSSFPPPLPPPTMRPPPSLQPPRRHPAGASNAKGFGAAKDGRRRR